MPRWRGGDVIGREECIETRMEERTVFVRGQRSGGRDGSRLEMGAAGERQGEDPRVCRVPVT